MKSMEKLSADFMKEYLKHVVELESSIYAQKKIDELAHRNMTYDRPLKQPIPYPTVANQLTHNYPKPDKNSQEYNYVPSGKMSPLTLAGIVVLLIGAIFFINGMNNGKTDVSLKGVILVLASVAMLFYAPYRTQKYNAEKVAEAEHRFNIDMDAYVQEERRNQEIMGVELDRYKRNVEAENQRYLLAVQKYDNSHENYDRIWKKLYETQRLLNKLYDKNIIFPKYRNLVALCTIYEYFLSGRCDELEGPNGAYNLYETELRQNLIINKMDTIICKLDEIKDNQYLLYSELKESNRMISDMKRSVNAIEKSAEDFAKSAAVSTYYAKILAKNTEALKYINLIN